MEEEDGKNYRNKSLNNLLDREFASVVSGTSESTLKESLESIDKLKITPLESKTSNRTKPPSHRKLPTSKLASASANNLSEYKSSLNVDIVEGVGGFKVSAPPSDIPPAKPNSNSKQAESNDQNEQELDTFFDQLLDGDGFKYDTSSNNPGITDKQQPNSSIDRPSKLRKKALNSSAKDLFDKPNESSKIEDQDQNKLKPSVLVRVTSHGRNAGKERVEKDVKNDILAEDLKPNTLLRKKVSETPDEKTGRMKKELAKIATSSIPDISKDTPPLPQSPKSPSVDSSPVSPFIPRSQPIFNGDAKPSNSESMVSDEYDQSNPMSPSACEDRNTGIQTLPIEPTPQREDQSTRRIRSEHVPVRSEAALNFVSGRNGKNIKQTHNSANFSSANIRPRKNTFSQIMSSAARIASSVPMLGKLRDGSSKDVKQHSGKINGQADSEDEDDAHLALDIDDSYSEFDYYSYSSDEDDLANISDFEYYTYSDDEDEALFKNHAKFGIRQLIINSDSDGSTFKKQKKISKNRPARKSPNLPDLLDEDHPDLHKEELEAKIGTSTDALDQDTGIPKDDGDPTPLLFAVDSELPEVPNTRKKGLNVNRKKGLNVNRNAEPEVEPSMLRKQLKEEMESNDPYIMKSNEIDAEEYSDFMADPKIKKKKKKQMKPRKYPAALRDPKVRKQIEQLKIKKPYFSYAIMIIEGIVLIAEFVYSYVETGALIETNPFNIMIGPSTAVLVRLGAKYTPCMRSGAEWQNSLYDCSSFYKGGTTSSTSTYTSGSLSLPPPSFNTTNHTAFSTDEYSATNFSISYPSFYSFSSNSMIAAPAKNNTGNIVSDSYSSSYTAMKSTSGNDTTNTTTPATALPAYICTLEEFCGLSAFSTPGVPDQWYRLFTAIFLHGGIIHYAANTMYWYSIGPGLEEVYGSIPIAFIYFISGVGGFLFSSISVQLIPSVGASGAIYGVQSCVMLDLLLNFRLANNGWKELGKSIFMLILYLALGLLPYIDNFAHIGGFLIGIVSGMFFLKPIYFSDRDRMYYLCCLYDPSIRMLQPARGANISTVYLWMVGAMIYRDLTRSLDIKRDTNDMGETYGNNEFIPHDQLKHEKAGKNMENAFDLTYIQKKAHEYKIINDKLSPPSKNEKQGPIDSTVNIGGSGTTEMTGFSYQPIQRPCGPHLDRNSHFVDETYWHSIKPEEMYEKRKEWKYFLSSKIPRIHYDGFGYNGRGIIYTASGRTLNRSIASIQLLRRLGCELPVQIWYMSGELDDIQLNTLRKFGNVYSKDIIIEQKNFEEFSDFRVGHAYGSARNYHIKTLVLLLSEFKEILYLDSDNMPLRNPEFLFDTQEFLETGALFWRDFWKFPSNNPLWQITEQPCEDEWEQESGQLVLDKEKSWKALLMSMYFQKSHDFYFKIILGDKDTFRFGWKVTDTKYHMVRHHVGIGGRIRGGRFCGHTMLQPAPDGEFIFAHTTAMKTTNGIIKGNTWESMQYLVPAASVQVESSGEERVAYRVGYPITYEYSGGAEKRAEDGGIGMETHPNPCLAFGIEDLVIETEKRVVDKLGLRDAVDSFMVITESFVGHSNGMFSWFEDAYYDMGGPGSRTDATCGNGQRGNGICQSQDECCSAWGWCGITVDHCGIGCLGGPCYKTRTLPERPSSNFDYCGGGNIGFGLCRDPETNCCSKFGWCGSSDDFCAVKNCLSGPCDSEGKV